MLNEINLIALACSIGVVSLLIFFSVMIYQNDKLLSMLDKTSSFISFVCGILAVIMFLLYVTYMIFDNLL